MSGNVSDWLSYVGRALKKVANTAGSTVCHLSVGFIPYFSRYCNTNFSDGLQGYT